MVEVKASWVVGGCSLTGSDSPASSFAEGVRVSRAGLLCRLLLFVFSAELFKRLNAYVLAVDQKLP